jgi:hypothetical protein
MKGFSTCLALCIFATPALAQHSSGTTSLANLLRAGYEIKALNIPATSALIFLQKKSDVYFCSTQTDGVAINKTAAAIAKAACWPVK